MAEQMLTDREVKALPTDERIQIALHEALGENDAANAYDAIAPLLNSLYREAHFCGVLCEQEGVARCDGNPFRTATS